MAQEHSDHLDDIVRQWNRERPDLDVSPMAVIGRITRVERSIRRRLEAVFAEHGLEGWEFDVPATLLRSGEPYELTPGQLLRSTMVTSGAMTNRLDRLEARGLVTRTPSRTDRRVVLVALTPAGHQLINRAVEAHVANEHTILTGLTDRQRLELARLLQRLEASVSEDPVTADG